MVAVVSEFTALTMKFCNRAFAPADAVQVKFVMDLAMALDTALQQRNDALAALKFYAEEKHYHQRGWQGDPDPSFVVSDRGNKAREAIARANS